MLATIHQPSSESYINFDKLILMCEGNIVYQGPSRDVPDYFKALDIQFRPFCNPADIMMRELSISGKNTERDE